MLRRKRRCAVTNSASKCPAAPFKFRAKMPAAPFEFRDSNCRSAVEKWRVETPPPPRAVEKRRVETPPPPRAV
jgi:hypothetical protein